MNDCCGQKQKTGNLKGEVKQKRDYTPLFVLLVVSGLVAGVISIQYEQVSLSIWMHSYMGFFLIVFAMLKLFDLKGFARGFAKYDLLAMRASWYAWLYPVIELLLGLAYLSCWESTLVYSATLVVMGFGALGVLRALQKKLDVECACMGATLNVPLSTVALVEDLGMVVMAGWMLLM